MKRYDEDENAYHTLTGYREWLARNILGEKYERRLAVTARIRLDGSYSILFKGKLLLVKELQIP
jgi:hypothetical protein